MKTLMNRAIDLAYTRGAQYANIRVVQNRTESMAVKYGIVENLNFAETIGFGVRVLAEGAWGFTSSRELLNEEIDRTTGMAFEIARASALVAGEKVELGSPVSSFGNLVTNVPAKNINNFNFTSTTV